MATDKGKEQEKFDFTSEGEELDYFNLDQTILHKTINRVQKPVFPCDLAPSKSRSMELVFGLR